MIKDFEGRKQIAKEEIDAWKGYLDARKEEIANLPAKKEELEEDIEYTEGHNESRHHFLHQISDSDYGKLKEFFDRFKVS